VSIVGAATAVLTGALEVCGPFLAAAGVNTAALSASISATAAAATAAGPAAPAVLVAVYLARTWRKIKRSAQNLAACRDRAGLWLLAEAAQSHQSVYVGRVPTIPTPDWDECWHKGKKTKGKAKGRTSERVPTTVHREDVLPSGQSGGPDLASIVIGRSLAPGELLIVPMLGPWGLTRGVLRANDIAGWAPGATAACIAASGSVVAQGGLTNSADRKLAARIAAWAGGIAAGGAYVQNGMTYKPNEETRKQARDLVYLCLALLGVQ